MPFSIGFYNEELSTFFRYVFNGYLVQQEAVIPEVSEGEEQLYTLRIFLYFIDPVAFGVVLASDGLAEVQPVRASQHQIAESEFRRVISAYLGIAYETTIP